MAESATTKKSESKSPEAPVRQSIQTAEVGQPSGAAERMFALQQAAGNRTVSRLFESAVQNSPTDGIIQRKCECGGGSCSNCKQDDELVQAKSSLPISQPGDAFEREADLVADGAMRHLNGSRSSSTAAISASSSPSIARASTAGGASSAPAPSSGFMSSQSAGQALPSEVRERMEGALGYDFGGVRVHNDGAASSAARDIHSEAFTYGSHIFFRENRYRPHNSDGQRLLAHELAHVVQQRGAQSTIGRQASEVPRIQRFTSQSELHRSICTADIARAGLKFPCKGPPSGMKGRRQMGTLIHSEIKKRFEKKPDRLTEVEVPGGATVCREAGIPWLPSTGSADLVKISRRGAKVVSAEVGEIKPMNLEGVALGSTQSLCYADKMTEVGDLCQNIFRGRIGKIREAEDPDLATSVRPILNMCLKTGASTGSSSKPGKTLRAKATLKIRPYTFSMTLGGRIRRIKVRSCLPGVIGYTCADEDKKKKKKKRRRRTKPRTKARPKPRPSLKGSKSAARKLARLNRMKRKLVRTTLKATRRIALKAGAKIAARAFARFIPVLGWVLTAIDVASAIYNIAKYGLNFGGGGEGGPQGEGEGTAEGAEGAEGAESAAEGVEGGTGGEGTTEAGAEGAEGGTAAEGSTEGEAGAETAGEGKGTAEPGTEEGTGTGEGESASETGGTTGGKKGEDPLDFLTDEEAEQVERIVEELPLSPELIEALKKSTPEQQQLLDLLIGRLGQPGQPRPTEEFFKKILELSEGLTPEQLAVLATLSKPASGQTLEQVMQSVEAAIKAVKSGATGKPSEAKDKPSGTKKAPAAESGDDKGTTGGTGGKGTAKKPGDGKSGDKGAGGSDKGGSEVFDPVIFSGIEPATDTDPNAIVIRTFEVISGLNKGTAYESGAELTPKIRVRYQGQRHEVDLPIIIKSRTKNEDTGEVEITAEVKTPPPPYNAWGVKESNLTIPGGAPFTFRWPGTKK